MIKLKDSIDVLYIFKIIYNLNYIFAQHKIAI